MHEKVLIVDGEVLWHGSLNLLSHSGSRDLMMRLTDASACTRVHHILGAAREDRPAWNPRGAQPARAANTDTSTPRPGPMGPRPQTLAYGRRIRVGDLIVSSRRHPRGLLSRTIGVWT